METYKTRLDFWNLIGKKAYDDKENKYQRDLIFLRFIEIHALSSSKIIHAFSNTKIISCTSFVVHKDFYIS